MSDTSDFTCASDSDSDNWATSRSKPLTLSKSSTVNSTSKVLEKKEAIASSPMIETREASNTSNIENAGSVSSKRFDQTKYQKLTPKEHVLRRPDTYVGSIEASEQQMWVYNEEIQSMVIKNLNLVPGLYKIFDEIIVNAADNKSRDSSMDKIMVCIFEESNVISVYNNGRGIPIEIHEKEQIWIPELIFGTLLTSSNYDDNEKKVTGGRNGYGAKLCNIFSSEFSVETADEKKKYKQTWFKNMAEKQEPKITENKTGVQYTKITFKPDFAKFGVRELDSDLKAVMIRRVYDLAGCLQNVKVYINGERIKIKNFKQYVELYTKSAMQQSNFYRANKPCKGTEEAQSASSLTTIDQFTKSIIVHEIFNDRWEIAFAVSDGEFKQVSFVNSIATTRGGTHVNYITDQITSKLIEIVKKKNKAGMQLKPFQIKNHLWVFINCLIENPTFDSQTKETLTLKHNNFGSKCLISDDFVKKISKTGVLERILSFAEYKADQQLKKTDGKSRSRIIGLPKLEDANLAGTKNGYKCTLILTEGDSAKTSAISGLSVVGRDYYGVFPLRGKLLNVREASHEQIMKNLEIQAIKKIMGLAHSRKYTSTSELRYGHLMIMADQDLDGSHIKGLIINYFETFFPSLLQIPGFLLEFITPIVRVTKNNRTLDFFTVPEFEYWKENNDDGKGWKIKYYKGLGTSSAVDVQNYFSDLDKHLKEFHEIQDGDRELIDLAFSKKRADNRKEWLRNAQPGAYMDYSKPKIPISEFINKELILFSLADNIRAIPSIIDGLKPSQRKVIYAFFKRKVKDEIKVAQMSGYVSQHTAYHHGEDNLMQTIIGLAQSFVGSNNLNLLEPLGQFGSRIQGGKDAASPRYLFTRLSKFARKLFKLEDDQLLNYLNEDGQDIEPDFFVPIIPLILINGSEGIGTGWSSYIPNFNPVDIVNNLKRLMEGEDLVPMHPWYRGFSGEIEKINFNKYKISGKITQVDGNTVEITELPIRFWTENMKEFLDMTAASDKGSAIIKDFQEHHTESKVHFIVKLTDKGVEQVSSEGLKNKFKLSKIISLSNMVAFDPKSRIKKYEQVEEILIQFYHVRLEYYHKRKAYLIKELNDQLGKLSNQSRFIKMIIDGELTIAQKKKAAIVQDLRLKNFISISPGHSTVPTESETLPGIMDETVDVDSGFDYLLNMPIHSFTAERLERLFNERSTKEFHLSKLSATNVKAMWINDLDEFLLEWEYALENDKKLTISSRNSVGNIKKRTMKDTQDNDEWSEKPNKKPKRQKIIDSDAKKSPVNIANTTTDLKDLSKSVDNTLKQSQISNHASLAVNGAQRQLKQTNLNDDDYLNKIIAENADKLRQKIVTNSKTKSEFTRKANQIVSSDSEFLG